MAGEAAASHEDRPGLLAGLAVSIRPWQWYKQAVLLLGIVFGGLMLDVAAWTDVLVGVLAFCALAGAVYLFNDIQDLERDRRHPTKRHRPIASGQVPVPVAGAAALVLAADGLALAFIVNVSFGLLAVAYLGLNVLYSTVLRGVLFVDVLVVALGFLIRAVAGAVAVHVAVSEWLVALVLLVALMLALGKRRHELEVASVDETRPTGEAYRADVLDNLLLVVMSGIFVFYTLYALTEGGRLMLLTLPPAYYGLFRYFHLVHSTEVLGEPELFFQDRASVVNLGLWALAVVAVLYGAPGHVAGLLDAGLAQADLLDAWLPVVPGVGP